MLNSSHFIHIQTYQSPVGEMVLGSYDNKLCLANWSDKKKSDRTNNRLKKSLDAVFVEESSEVIEQGWADADVVDRSFQERAGLMNYIYKY